MKTVQAAPRPFLLGLAAVVGFYLIRATSFWHYVNDDAYITFRYARFLALGRGPYFNIGEHVEGYTNFLLMLALAPVYWLGGEAAVPLAAKIIGVASGIGSVTLTALLTRRFLRDHPVLGPKAGWIAVISAGFVATIPGYALNSTSGLATVLFGFWATLGVGLAIRGEDLGRWHGAGLAFAALVLTRPEGTVVFAAAWIGLAVGRLVAGAGTGRAWWRRAVPRRAITDGLIVAGTVAGHTVFRLLAYDGEWLPNTYHAKAGGFWGSGAWEYVEAGILAPFFGVVGAGIGLAGALWWVRRQPLALAMIFPAVTGALLPFVTGSDWMAGGRLVVPYLPLFSAVIVMGWAFLLILPLRKVPWVAVAVAAGVVLVSFGLGRDEQREFVRNTRLRARGYATGHEELARWLCGGAAKPGDAVALMDIGILGYRCIDQRMVDITGLTDRHIAKSAGRFMHKEFDLSYLLDKEPRFFVLVYTTPGVPYRPPPPPARFRWWTPVANRLVADPEFQRYYVRRRQVRIGSDTSWTDVLTGDIGAERVFEHAHPGRHYLLAVFERRD